MEKTETQKTIQMNFEGIKQLSIMYNDLGMLNYQDKKYEKALNDFEEAIKYYDIIFKSLDRTAPDNQSFLNILQQQITETRVYIIDISKKLGDEKFEMQEYEEALSFYKNIVYCGLDETICIKISDCLIELKSYVSAVGFLEMAVGINPDNVDLLVQIGDIYRDKICNYEKAIYFYEKYLEKEHENKRNLAIVYCLAGHSYEKLDRYKTIDKQINYFEKAIEVDPTFVQAYNHLVLIYPVLKRYDDALNCYKKIFDLGATMDNFFAYACLNIQLKNFKEGWKYYEYRFSKEKDFTEYPKMPKPKWKGEDISEKTLLIQCEQGFGDIIQFSRYIKLLQPQAKKILFRVRNELVDLFKSNFDGIEIIKNSTPLDSIDFDCHIPLMSLPYRLQATVEDIPFTDGYIKAIPEKIKQYKKDYFDNDKIKIGISWRGASYGNRERDIPLETFLPLGRLKNVQLYSLQKSFTVEELDKLPMDIEIIKLGRNFNTFSDTAAAIANLDFVISCDNGTFNLAGAMGVKTSLLLNFNSDWRWFSDGDETPWYKNVKVYRIEKETDAWDELMHKVASDLSEQIG